MGILYNLVKNIICNGGVLKFFSFLLLCFLSIFVIEHCLFEGLYLLLKSATFIQWCPCCVCLNSPLLERGERVVNSPSSHCQHPPSISRDAQSLGPLEYLAAAAGVAAAAATDFPRSEPPKKTNASRAKQHTVLTLSTPTRRCHGEDFHDVMNKTKKFCVARLKSFICSEMRRW